MKKQRTSLLSVKSVVLKNCDYLIDSCRDLLHLLKVGILDVVLSAASR